MPSSLERRVAELEAQLDAVQRKLAALDPTKPWWEHIARTFERDPVYEKAMRLGQQYRKSQRPKPKRPKKKT